ncbi:hypothetical protein SAMN05421874_128111 [Nonomuraea maritima]|uniref:Uncharacterized protein n=1 Tax=Nonomuraea maritima TaxID=683260 RepID=A0A1G9MP29_9ACTN|nr:hypothetical protein [Nonomuraea maritima]SDL75667.1 hypothetical protein SAMN05421874_128111 [Nonomuraea maritima]
MSGIERAIRARILRDRELLREAAAAVLDAAAVTSSTPWRPDGNSVNSPGTYVAIAYQCFGDAEWMALTDPTLAEPLAAVFREAADEHEQHVDDDTGDHERCGGTVLSDCSCFVAVYLMAVHLLVKAGRIPTPE